MKDYIYIPKLGELHYALYEPMWDEMLSSISSGPTLWGFVALYWERR